jgi:hypothetical protein
LAQCQQHAQELQFQFLLFSTCLQQQQLVTQLFSEFSFVQLQQHQLTQQSLQIQLSQHSLQQRTRMQDWTLEQLQADQDLSGLSQLLHIHQQDQRQHLFNTQLEQMTQLDKLH